MDNKQYLLNNINKVLTVPVGKNSDDKEVSLNLYTNQHLLITGTTGSGKDTFLCSLIHLLMRDNEPSVIKFILVDGTRVVLTPFQDSTYLLAPIITDIDTTPGMFEWLLKETEHRYDELLKEKARNIWQYNETKGKVIFPLIFVVIRELADLMYVDSAYTEKSIIKIAGLTKATGIHLIVASQLASENIFTGLIKANISTRIAFHTGTLQNSMVILDKPGAETLKGKGDMLLLTYDSVDPIRLTSTYIGENEISKFVEENKSNDYDQSLLNTLTSAKQAVEAKKDELYDEALRIFQSEKEVSASLLQKRLQIGYSRASRLLEDIKNSGEKKVVEEIL